MHVLFDLDGTLTDPEEGITKCIRYAMSSLDISLAADVDLASYIGPPLHHTFRELCGEEDLSQTAISIYRERYARLGLYENEVYEGIPECLKQLSGSVETIHVATSKPTVFSKQIIEHFQLNQYFDHVYGSELNGRLSDKTELIGHILKHEGLPPENTVMIGDRRFDIIGAKNHGLKTIGVLWGHGSKDELNTSGADRLCDHPIGIHEQVMDLL